MNIEIYIINIRNRQTTGQKILYTGIRLDLGVIIGTFVNAAVILQQTFYKKKQNEWFILCITV